jgi:hypothetical protein
MVWYEDYRTVRKTPSCRRGQRSSSAAFVFFVGYGAGFSSSLGVGSRD